MSVGRSLESEVQPIRGLTFLQWVRVVAVVVSSLAITAIVWRWGIPERWDGRAGLLLFLVGMFLVSGVAFVIRQWPRAMPRPVQKMMQKMDPNRRLRFTRDGKILVFITVAEGAAAVNTGNNFLYLVLGMLLALIGVSGFMSEWGLRDIRVTLEPGGDRFAETAGLLAFHVFNQKTRINSMSIEVKPLVRPPGVDERVVATELQSRLFLRLAPGSQTRGVVRAQLPMRGVWKLVGFEVGTAYPFGFFRKWKYEVPDVSEPSDVLVYPAPAPVSEQMRKIRLLVGERPGMRAGQGEEFFSLRDHNLHEDVRRVAWKRSAKVGRLVVRETEEPRGRTVTLVIPGGVETPTPEQLEAYERAHRVACGLIMSLLDRGDVVGVVAGAYACAPCNGPDAREKLFPVLARARLQEPVSAVPPESAAGVIVLVDGPGNPAPGTKIHGHVAGDWGRVPEGKAA